MGSIVGVIKGVMGCSDGICSSLAPPSNSLSTPLQLNVVYSLLVLVWLNVQCHQCHTQLLQWLYELPHAGVSPHHLSLYLLHPAHHLS